MKALAILVGLGGVAAADPSATIYFNGGQKSSGSDGVLVVKIDDDAKGTLAAIAGPSSKKGALVCYKAEDKAFLVGCYVAIGRDGFVSAPMFDAKKAAKEGEQPFIHPMPSIEGGVGIKAVGKDVEIQILGGAGNAIALWANCNKPKQGLLVCGTNSGMAGKLSWEPSFRVTAGGKIVVGK